VIQRRILQNCDIVATTVGEILDLHYTMKKKAIQLGQTISGEDVFKKRVSLFK